MSRWKQYKTFLEIYKINKTRNIGETLLQKDGQLKRDSKDKAEILNDQFKSVFTLDKENNSSTIEGPKIPHNRQPQFKH